MSLAFTGVPLLGSVTLNWLSPTSVGVSPQ